MYSKQGTPKIFNRKKMNLLDVIIFIVKYCLLLDTSELFVENRTRNIKEVNSCEDASGGFDLVDFFTFPVTNVSGELFGGSNSFDYEKQRKEDQYRLAKQKEEEDLAKRRSTRDEGKRELLRREKEKQGIKDSVRNEIKSKDDEVISIDSGRTGEETVINDFIKIIKDTIKEGTITVSNKIKGVLMIFIYASVYPAVPFFAVMAVMFATLKYIFFKIRIF